MIIKSQIAKDKQKITRYCMNMHIIEIDEGFYATNTKQGGDQTVVKSKILQDSIDGRIVAMLDLLLKFGYTLDTIKETIEDIQSERLEDI